MTPVEILKYVVEKLEGSSFEPWVNLLLFLLFVAAIYKVIVVVLGKDTINSVSRLVKSSLEALNKSTEYAPGAEAVRKKVWPYVNLAVSLYMSLIGFLSSGIVALAYYIATRSDVPIKVHVLAILWVIGSLLFAKVNIAQATWAWHEIREIKADKSIQPTGNASAD